MLAGEVNTFLGDEDTEHYLKIFTLLYADDTIVLAESDSELQNALNAVREYCEMWQLTVNTEKKKTRLSFIRKERLLTTLHLFLDTSI